MRSVSWPNGPPIEILRKYCDLHDLVERARANKQPISIREAARQLKSSASALSNLLANLEEYFGLDEQSLFDRQDRRGCCAPNDRSRTLYKQAYRCVKEHDLLLSWPHQVVEVIRIGAPILINDYVLPNVIRKCRQKWGEEAAAVDFEYRDEENFLGRIGHLRNGRYDVVIDVAGTGTSNGPGHFPGVHYRIIKGFRIPPYLLIPKYDKSDQNRDLFELLRCDNEETPISVKKLEAYPVAVSDNAEMLARLPAPNRKSGCRTLTNTTISVVHQVRGGGYVGVVYAWQSLVKRWKDLYGVEVRPFAVEDKLPEFLLGTYARDPEGSLSKLANDLVQMIHEHVANLCQGE